MNFHNLHCRQQLFSVTGCFWHTGSVHVLEWSCLAYWVSTVLFILYVCSVYEYAWTCAVYACSFNRSFKALLKLPSLVKSLHQLSSTHGITPLLEVFAPQLVSTGVKNILAEEQSDFYVKPLLGIALELLNEIEFERSLVITIGRSVLAWQWEKFLVLFVHVFMYSGIPMSQNLERNENSFKKLRVKE